MQIPMKGESMRLGLIAAILCGLAPMTIGCSVSPGKPTAPSVAAVTTRIVLADGRDRTASQSAEDWVTYADHVVVVTVVSEVRGEASKVELERQEGIIGRRVTLRIDTVLWSAPKPAQPAPKTIEQEAVGWVFNDNNGAGEAVMAVAESPRLEPGHTYVRALDWVDDPCSKDPSLGRWAGLGGGGTIPYDHGILGEGEFEGRMVTLDEAIDRSRAKDPLAQGLRDEVVGKTVDTLLVQIRAATPRSATQIDSRECDISDR